MRNKWRTKDGNLNFNLLDLTYKYTFYSYDFNGTEFKNISHTYLTLVNNYAVGRYVFVDEDGYIFWNYATLTHDSVSQYTDSLLKSYKTIPKDKFGNWTKLNKGFYSIETLSGEGIHSQLAILMAERDTPRKTITVNLKMSSVDSQIELYTVDEIDAATTPREFDNQKSPGASITVSYLNTIYSLILTFTPYYGTYEGFRILKFSLKEYYVYTTIVSVFNHNSLSISHFEVHFPILIENSKPISLGSKPVNLIYNKSTSSIFINFSAAGLNMWKRNSFEYDTEKFKSQMVKIIPLVNLISLI